MAPPDDHQPPRPTRQRTAAPGPAEHPSGRWELERFDSEATPPPVDPTAAYAWERIRERLNDLEIVVAGINPALDGLKGQVEGLKVKESEMSKILGALVTSNALQTQSLTTIERGIAELKAQREGDGTRFRHVIQILVAVAALASSIVAIVLANR